MRTLVLKKSCSQVLLFLLLFLFSFPAYSQQPPEKKIRIGFIGSLSGFAGSYGTAVLEGAQIALDELKSEKHSIEFFIEDDQSAPKSTATSYQKLKAVNKIQGLITGTWWANSIVHTVERDGIPFLSCETLYNKDFVSAPNYFSLVGDLRTWVQVYEPLIAKQNWKRGAIVRFISGFADTLSEEMKVVFSRPGRIFLKDLQYSDFEMSEAGTLATQIKALNPDVLYIDAQPSGVAKLIKKLGEQDTKDLAIISNSIVGDAVKQKLFDPKLYSGKIFHTEREAFRSEFREKFERRYQRPPQLNSDLGYAAVKLLWQALQTTNPVEKIRSGTLRVGTESYKFDEHNVHQGIRQQVYQLIEGQDVLVE